MGVVMKCLLLLFFIGICFAQEPIYGSRLCNEYQYDCKTIKKGQSWYGLWPDVGERDLVRRVNRMNTSLQPGMVIAVPRNLHRVDVIDIAPFARVRSDFKDKTILVKKHLHAWAAYDEDGYLVNWGPASLGRNWCDDINAPCKTITGHFKVYHMRGHQCISKQFPVGRGGAAMPYCTFFKAGYALHGSYNLPGYHASHGCIRLFPDDARWLQQEFIEKPTYVIVE